MRLNYTYFDREEIQGRTVQYEFEPPFYENLDAELKMEYGEALTFVKEINHRDRIIRIHSAYDSGKGTKYVPPKKPKKGRQILRLRLKHILSLMPEDIPFVLKLENEWAGEDLHIIWTQKWIRIIENGSVDSKGNVSGITDSITKIDGALFRYLRFNKFYPYEFEYLTFPEIKQ
jgi:hypothetical protein